MLTDERYKQLMVSVGLPNSRSLLQALKQCAMEAALNERAVLAKAGEQKAVGICVDEVDDYGLHSVDFTRRVEQGQKLYAHPLPAQAIPEGWQLVPIEPTQHQLHEAYDNHLMEPFSHQSTGHEVAKRIYKTMLSASPKP